MPPRRDPLGPAARGRSGSDTLLEVIGGARNAPSEPPREPPAAEPEAAEPKATPAPAGESGKPSRGRGAEGGAAITGDAPEPRRRGSARPAGKPVQRAMHAVRLPADLLESARDAAYWTRRRLNDLFVEGIGLRLKQLEKENGKPFEPRPDELSPGRLR